jgi:hypothetical protein
VVETVVSTSVTPPPPPDAVMVAVPEEKLTLKFAPKSIVPAVPTKDPLSLIIIPLPLPPPPPSKKMVAIPTEEL